MGAEMFHADGRKDRYDEANSLFSQFSERFWKKKSLDADYVKYATGCLEKKS
jgi:hypothetical protein